MSQYSHICVFMLLVGQIVFMKTSSASEQAEDLLEEKLPNTGDRPNQPADDPVVPGDSVKGKAKDTNPDSSMDSSESEEKADYGKGSVCVYCKYCKFCELCDKDCPCEKSSTKPNCDLCKYCKYCYLCSSVCENFCQPGSFLDTISAAIYTALPKFDNKMKKEVEDDIHKVKDWIKEYL